jgi:hypothetical protein
VFKRADPPAQHTLNYLESLADLSLTLHAADASDERGMAAVVDSLVGPIGGCMLLSIALTDKTYAGHSESSYRATFPSKVGAFKIVEKLIDVSSLDFLVAFTSVSALFGNAGQTNYGRCVAMQSNLWVCKLTCLASSANTIVEGMVHRYSHAFALVVPAITDSATVMESSGGRLDHVIRFGYTSNRKACRHTCTRPYLTCLSRTLYCRR